MNKIQIANVKISEYIFPKAWEKNHFRVKVVTRQPKTEFFAVMDDGTLKIRLKAVPERGRANKELIRFLSDELGVSESQIEVISGVTDTVKMIRISG